MKETLLLQIVNPLLIALHSVAGVENDRSFDFRHGHVEAHSPLHRPQVFMPRQLDVLLASLIWFVADARLKLESLVLPVILSIDAEVRSDVAQFSLREGFGLHRRIMLRRAIEGGGGYSLGS